MGESGGHGPKGVFGGNCHVDLCLWAEGLEAHSNIRDVGSMLPGLAFQVGRHLPEAGNSSEQLLQTLKSHASPTDLTFNVFLVLGI